MWNFEKPPLQKCFHAAHICWIHLCHNLCAAKKKTCVPPLCSAFPFSCTRANICLPGVPVLTLCRSFVFSFLYFLRSAMNRYFLPEVQFATPLDPTCLRLQNPKAVTTWFTSYAPCLSKKQALPVNIFQILFSAFPLSAEVCAQKWTIFNKLFQIL